MRRRLSLVLLVVAIAILWRPFLRPVGAGAILVADIYSSALWDRNLAAYVTPPPRVGDGTERVGAQDMRVTWWIPGWGSLHPAVMLVNGATDKGNDDPETRRLGEALARAGYMVMLPEFPFIKAGRLEREATALLDAAFARAIARPETKGMAVGAAEALADSNDRERITAELRSTGGRLSGEPPSGLGARAPRSGGPSPRPITTSPSNAFINYRRPYAKCSIPSHRARPGRLCALRCSCCMTWAIASSR